MKKIWLFSSVFFLSLSLCACNNTNTTITRLQILQNPNKLEYITGELFDPTGLVLGVQFADGKTSKVTEGYTYSPTEELTEDDIQEMVENGEMLLINVQLHKNRRTMKASCQIQATPKFNYYEE